MKKRNKSSVFTALVLVLLGAILLMRNFKILDFAIPWEYFSFALIPIFIGIKAIFDRNYLFGIFITLIGIAVYIPKFLTPDQRETYRSLWPLVLIFIGVYILLEKKRKGDKHILNVNQGMNEDDYIVENNFLSGSSKKYISNSFRGGKISCIMGGSELDLTAAKIVSPAELQVDCVMGGLELKIPRDWNVQIKVSPILGGIEDKAETSAPNLNKTLIINGLIIMGGVEIERY